MKKCIKCGSHAFNLYAEEIDQGGFCDVHYWQSRAHRAEAQPEQEPVAWFSTLPDGRLSIKIVGKPTEGNWEPLYTTLPQRQPLSYHKIAQILDHERMKWHKSPPTYEFDLAFARAIEAAHGIKE